MITYLLMGVGALLAFVSLETGFRFATPAAVAWAAAVVVWLAVHLHARRSWRRAAKRLGFSREKGPFHITGALRGQRATASAYFSPDLFVMRRTRYEIDLGPSFPSNFAIAPAWLKKHGAVPTGQPAFDREVAVRGDEADVMGRLDADTRERLADLVEHCHLELDNRQLRYARPFLAQSADAMVRRLTDLQELAARLGGGGETPAHRLWQNALNDTVPEVRRRCLQLLLERHPKSPEAVHAATAAMSHEDSAIRMAAALVAGPDGESTLAALSEATDVPEEVRLRALETLAKRSAPALTAVVERLLGGAPGPVRRLAIKIVGHHRLPVGDDLAALAPGDEAEERAIAVALQLLPVAPSERVWLALLHHPNKQFARKSIVALSDTGGHDGMLALKRLAERREVASELRSLALRGVQAIQSRMGSQPGQLTLAPQTDEGALSLTQHEKT